MHNKTRFFFQKHIFEQHIFPFTNIDQKFSKQKKKWPFELNFIFFLERRYFWPDDSDKRQGI